MSEKEANGPPGQQNLTIQQPIDLAVEHHNAGRLPEAEGIYQQILQADPNQPAALHLLGVIAHQVGKNDTAVDFITKALAINPGYAEAHNNLGLALQDLGKLDEAVASYLKALAINPDDAGAHNNLGNALQDLGKLDEAVASYLKALAINSDDAEAHYNLGLALQELGKLDDAVASYHKALSLNPNFAEAHTNLGNVYQQLGKLDDAVASYHKALALKPDLAEAHNNLGVVLKDLGRLEDAVASCHKALALKPDSPEAHYNLGASLQKMGEYESAVYNYQVADTGDARAKLLECLYILEKYEVLQEVLENHAEADKENLFIAAISVFTSHQLDRENPHSFCKNPLDFVRVGKIANSAEKIDDLVDRVLEELENVYAVWEPPSVTTIEGFQTPGNLFANPEGNVAKLNNIIKREIAAYHSEFNSKGGLFIEQWPPEHRLRGWMVRLFKGGHQTGHIHPAGWISGVIYMKLPKSSEGDDGCIEFNLGSYSLPHLREEWPTKVHRPEKGQIVLFPSSLFHRTFPTTTDEERISLSFDLFPA